MDGHGELNKELSSVAENPTPNQTVPLCIERPGDEDWITNGTSIGTHPRRARRLPVHSQMYLLSTRSAVLIIDTLACCKVGLRALSAWRCWIHGFLCACWPGARQGHSHSHSLPTSATPFESTGNRTADTPPRAIKYLKEDFSSTTPCSRWRALWRREVGIKKNIKRGRKWSSIC